MAYYGDGSYTPWRGCVVNRCPFQNRCRWETLYERVGECRKLG